MNYLLLVLGFSFIGLVQADMVALEDSELSEVQGAGIGFALEGILFDANQATITINDINNGSGQNVPISVKEFYLGASGSNKGALLNPVSIGRLSQPFTVGLVKGEDLRSLRDDGAFVQTTPNNLSVLELAFPAMINGAGGQACIDGYAAAGSRCSSRASERVDLGVRFDFKVAPNRVDVLNIDVAELVMDGSYLRLWGDSSRAQLVGEARLNIYAKTLEMMSCAAGASNCVTVAEQAARTVYLTNAYANVSLGYGKSQPLLFDVASNGQFVLELPNPVRDPNNPGANVTTLSGIGKSRADDFYANAPRTNIVIGNLNFGGTRPGYGQVPTGGYNFGQSEIRGFSFNYLKVTSRDL
jgi:hypothetical protein